MASSSLTDINGFDSTRHSVLLADSSEYPAIGHHHSVTPAIAERVFITLTHVCYGFIDGEYQYETSPYWRQDRKVIIVPDSTLSDRDISCILNPDHVEQISGWRDSVSVYRAGNQRSISGLWWHSADRSFLVTKNNGLPIALIRMLRLRRGNKKSYLWRPVCRSVPYCDALHMLTLDTRLVSI